MQEVGHRFGDLRGMRDGQGGARAFDLGVLCVWKPGADEVADLEEPSVSVATTDVKDRTDDLFASFSSNCQLSSAGRSVSKNVSRSRSICSLAPVTSSTFPSADFLDPRCLAGEHRAGCPFGVGEVVLAALTA
jgi:hypothetical protein